MKLELPNPKKLREKANRISKKRRTENKKIAEKIAIEMTDGLAKKVQIAASQGNHRVILPLPVPCEVDRNDIQRAIFDLVPDGYVVGHTISHDQWGRENKAIEIDWSGTYH